MSQCIENNQGDWQTNSAKRFAPFVLDSWSGSDIRQFLLHTCASACRKDRSKDIETILFLFCISFDPRQPHPSNVWKRHQPAGSRDHQNCISRSACWHDVVDKLKKGQQGTGADPGFGAQRSFDPGGGGALSPKFAQNRLKTAWFWKNLGHKGGGGNPGPPRSASEGGDSKW